MFVMFVNVVLLGFLYLYILYILLYVFIFNIFLYIYIIDQGIAEGLKVDPGRFLLGLRGTPSGHQPGKIFRARASSEATFSDPNFRINVR